MAYDVFISHSVKNKAVADALCERLEAAGMQCWMAPRDILPGLEWGEAIMNGIKQSRVFLLVFSSHANASKQVLREVERAASRDMVLLPVRVEDVEPSAALEYYISTPQWLDAITPPLEPHLDRLVRTVAILLDQPEAAPGPAGERVVPGAPAHSPVREQEPVPAPRRQAKERALFTTPAPRDSGIPGQSEVSTTPGFVRADARAAPVLTQGAAAFSGATFSMFSVLGNLGFVAADFGMGQGFVYLMCGVWGLFAAFSVAAARFYLRLGAIANLFLVLLWIFSLASDDISILSTFEVVLHAMLTLWMAYFGFLHREVGAPG